MKINPADFAMIKLGIDLVRNRYPHMEAVYAASKASHERFRWDTLFLSGVDIDSLYKYANDANIDTALRAVMGNSYA